MVFSSFFQFNYEIKPPASPSKRGKYYNSTRRTPVQTHTGGDEGYSRASRVISDPVSSRNVRLQD